MESVVSRTFPAEKIKPITIPKIKAIINLLTQKNRFIFSSHYIPVIFEGIIAHDPLARKGNAIHGKVLLYFDIALYPI